MTLNLNLDPELEERLKREAEREGVLVDKCALELLERHLPPQGQQKNLIHLLQSWIDEADDQEQRETGEYLVQALDEDRLSDRRLFPPELKGESPSSRASVKEARQNFRAVLDDVAMGLEVTILRRGTPVARLVPPPEEREPLPSRQEFRKTIRVSGQPLSEQVIEWRDQERY